MKRQTGQRQAIIHVLESATGPLTPQEICEKANHQKKGLGIATVYRTLAQLVEEDEVMTVNLPSESARYEMKVREHRHHFCCTVCGQVFGLEPHCPIALLDGATLPNGYIVTHHALTLYGICDLCQKQLPLPKAPSNRPSKHQQI
ncbi:MAG: transcriptional repressor [Deinococcales bacterium]